MNSITHYAASAALLFGGFLLASCESTQSASADGYATQQTHPFDRSTRPPSGPLPKASFPEYETVTLENGLTLYLIESDRQPTVTYRMMIRSGGLYDGDKPGLSELVADLLPKGVEGKSAYEIAAETDFIGGSIGVESSSDFTSVTVSGLSKYQEQLLTTLSELARVPTFPEEELVKMKQRYLSNLQSERQDPSAMAGLLRRKLVYGETGYGLYKSEESIESIARSDLEAFHQAHFLPNNASLAIVGDFDPGEALAMVEEHLGDWEKGEVPELPDLNLPTIDGVSVHILDRPDSVQSTLRVAQQTVDRSHPDVLALRALLSVLGGGSSGRMFLNLREDKGYTYGAYSFAANAAHSGAIVTAVEVRNEVTADAVREILHELRRIQEEPIPEPELSRHQKYLGGSYIISLESADTIATRVQEIDIYDLDPNFYRDYVTRLSELNPQKLKALAESRIEADDLVIAVVGNASEIAEPLSQLGPVTIYNDRLEVVERP